MGSALALAGAIGVCLVGGLLPWASTEAAVAAAALVVPRGALPLLVVGAALGHVLAKGALYGLARWAPGVLPARVKAGLERMGGAVPRGRSFTLTVLASSTTGVPPLYLATLAWGAMAAPLGRFLVAAFAGTVVRYALLSLVAVLARGGP
jgi:membrane protein YqaA with SNARE-associated domain